MNGTITPLKIVPSRPPAVCSDCTSGYLGTDGVYCREFNEVIYDERTAESCPMYDPGPQSRKASL